MKQETGYAKNVVDIYLAPCSKWIIENDLRHKVQIERIHCLAITGNSAFMLKGDRQCHSLLCLSH
ncbi:MAG: hypothetical protein IJ244_01200 [Bacteroidaceae bacterium]|nr:hypothetical protein [Bacteroidaceae bacterium]